MKVPIVIYERGEVYIFKSPKEAEDSLEVMDVENDEYVAYDSVGNLLRLEVLATPIKVPLLTFLKNRKVTIRDSDPVINRSSELREIIAKYLSHPRVGMSKTWVSQAPLEKLIEKAQEYTR